MINLSQSGDLLQRSKSSPVHYCHSDVINQLLTNEKVCIPNRIENFAHREGRRSVLANDAKSFLQLRRNRIFQPEQVIWLQILS
jgi:hypothetical protein